MNDTICRVAAYIGARLKEPSTYPALILALTAGGAVLSAEQREAIMAIGMFAAGLIGAALPDRVGKKNDRVTDPPTQKEPT